MPEHRPLWVAALVVSSILSAPPVARAQAGMDHLEDASTTPRGLFRLRAITVWTRYDQRFDGSRLTALGAPYTADSLGTAQLPDLTTTQSLVQSATGSPSFRLSLGRSQLDAMVREEHVPITLEYGATSRLSLALVVPVVRKRIAGFFRLDSAGANMGPNPHRVSTGASQNNGQVQTEFSLAASQLQGRLQACVGNPSGPGCAALLARQAEAQQLIQSSQAFASDLAALYGSLSSTGMAFVPRNQSAAQAAIAARVADFNLKYRDLLVSPVNVINAIPAAAAGSAGSADLEEYLTSELGRDSIARKERVGVGDWEIGVKFRAVDRPAKHRRDLGVRLAIASTARFPSGSRRSSTPVADLRLGDGGIGFDARAILELQRGRFALRSAGSFTLVGSAAGDTLHDSHRVALDIAPQWHLSGPLAVHAAFSQRRGDVSGTDQLRGGGVSFTTLSTYRAGSRPLPMEMRFTHLETARGDAGAPKFTRDQLEVRIYYQPGAR